MTRQPDPTMRDALRARLVEDVRATAPGAGRSPVAARSRAAAWVTGAVALVLVVTTVLVLRLSPDGTRPDVPAGPTSSAAERALLERALPTQPGARTALTWTERARGATGGPVDLTGRSVLLAGACTGGGAVTITVTGRPDTVLRCDGVATTGPTLLVDRDHPSRSRQAISIDVAPTGGRPRYLVRTSTIDPALIPTPDTTRACGADQLRFTSTAMGGALGTDYGSIAVTNRSGTACTLHGTPTARLAARASGAPIGPEVGHVGSGGGAPPVVALEPGGGRAHLRVSMVNIANYRNADGTYGAACGHAVTGGGWMLTLPGARSSTWVPLARPTLLCSDHRLQVASIGSFEPGRS